MDDASDRTPRSVGCTATRRSRSHGATRGSATPASARRSSVTTEDGDAAVAVADVAVPGDERGLGIGDLRGSGIPGLVPFGLSLLVANTASSAIRGRRQMGSIAQLGAPSPADWLRSAPSMPGAFWALIHGQGSSARLRALADAGVPVFILHGDRDLAIWFRFARDAASAVDAMLVRMEGGRHSWLLESADSLPALVGSLLDGPLGAALDRKGEQIFDLYGPEALALTLDRPRSKPYELISGHHWRGDV